MFLVYSNKITDIDKTTEDYSIKKNNNTYFKVPKGIRLNNTYYFKKKILQNIALA